jgi:hypothetical protein
LTIKDGSIEQTSLDGFMTTVYFLTNLSIFIGFVL